VREGCAPDVVAAPADLGKVGGAGAGLPGEISGSLSPTC
jgi:hypothetical protein